MGRIPQYCRTPTTPVCGTGILADGRRISLDGSTTVIFKLGSKKVQHQFLIAELSNHILLGVDFLKKYQCYIDFKNCQLSIQGSWIQCCNADREPLQVSVQRKRLTPTPADSELMMNAQMNCVWTDTPCHIESMRNTPDMHVANALHEPRGPDAQIGVLDTTNEPLVLQPRRKAVTKSATVEVVEASENGIGGEHFSSHLDERMPVWKQNLTVEDISGVKRPIPCLHQAMFSADKYDAVHTNSTRHIIPALERTQPTKQGPYRHGPYQHQVVFSADKHDAVHTNSTRHIIPALGGTRPIRQKPYGHGLIQEDEIEKQVKEHDLVEKGLGAKLRPKYVGSHAITKSLPCQAYEIKRDGKTSVQHEGRVRLYVSEESVDNSQEQVEAVECESFQPAKKHTTRVPTHLKSGHANRCQVAWPILGQNRVFEGGGEVNSNKQAVINSGGPEKGRCVREEPRIFQFASPQALASLAGHLSPDKCTSTSMCPTNTDFKYSHGAAPLRATDSFIYLGVCVCSSLSFNNHINCSDG